MERTIEKKLLGIQAELNAPKNQFNKFGNYHYRSCEDIYTAIKPLLEKYDCTLTLTDELVLIGERYYIKATALLSADGENITVNAYAREEETKRGMDGSQITGASSSYARKYALNGLFLIDDVKDSDTTNAYGKDGFANKEVTEKTYRSWFDKFFTENPDRLDKFLRHYKIKSTDQLDTVLTLKDIDDLISKLKKG